MISIDIKNTGNIIGKEVVQLYIRDHYATISPSLKKLKRFTKIELEPLEERTVSFTINNDDLKFYGKQNKWITEEGKFSVIVNNLSKDFNLPGLPTILQCKPTDIILGFVFPSSYKASKLSLRYVKK